MGHEPADFTKLKQNSGRAPRRRTRHALCEQIIEGAAKDITALDATMSSTLTTGASSGSRPSIAPSCGWRFMK